MREFHYIGYAQEVIFGAGSLAQLSAAVDRFHWQHLMLCASSSARRSGHVSSIETVLGDRVAAIYDHVQPHVPDFQVAEAAALAAKHQVDAVIGLGGGSPIGMAKAVSQALEEKRTGQLARASFPTDQPLVPIVAIPTTYAGSEMTAVYGVTHHADGSAHKITVTDPKITPKLVIYDPQLTLDLPPTLTASSGINALAHCVEAVYSITRHPLSTAAALSGAQHIVQALPRCHSSRRRRRGSHRNVDRIASGRRRTVQRRHGSSSRIVSCVGWNSWCAARDRQCDCAAARDALQPGCNGAAVGAARRSDRAADATIGRQRPRRKRPRNESMI